MKAVTIDEVAAWRDAVAERIARAEAADPGMDPIGHDLSEHHACVAELDAWIAELEADRQGGAT